MEATRAPWAGAAAAVPTRRPAPPSVTAERGRDESKLSQRLIGSQRDLDAWLRSSSCRDFIRFLTALNDSVIGKPNDADCVRSPVTEALLALLDRLAALVDEVPPVQQEMRYGNKAYRTWHQRVKDEAPALVNAVADAVAADAAADTSTDARREVTEQLIESIGNFTRIDYGTGHELAFIIMLFAAAAARWLSPADYPALVLHVFRRYIAVMQRVQSTYFLEPAGSHGVWSLDDYQFLPFYFGAAQLREGCELRPSAVLDAAVVEQHAERYMYFGSVAFVLKMKTGGSFGEHSPILNDISAVPLWSKVNTGLMKMFRVEVIGKFPVMQHVRFGKLFAWQRDDDAGARAAAAAAAGGGNATAVPAAPPLAAATTATTTTQQKQ